MSVAAPDADPFLKAFQEHAMTADQLAANDLVSIPWAGQQGYARVGEWIVGFQRRKPTFDKEGKLLDLNIEFTGPATAAPEVQQALNRTGLGWAGRAVPAVPRVERLRPAQRSRGGPARPAATIARGTARIRLRRAGAYGFDRGTSMASPHVAGVAALAFTVNPNASVQMVRDAILNGGDPVASMNGRTVSGRRLNARGTLKLMSPASLVVNGDRSGAPTADTILVRLDPANTGFVQVLVNNVQTDRVPAAGVSSIHVNGLGGNDDITVDGSITVPTRIDGGDGDDRLVGGSGNDFIDDQGGNDFADGQYDNDVIIGDLGSDTYLGGDGVDEVN